MNINELTAKLKAAALAAKSAKARLETSPDMDVALFDSESIKSDVFTLNKLVVLASPENLLALTEALEAAEQLNKHLDLAVRKAEGVSEALRDRLERAELEARTLTVKLPESVIDAICHTAAEIHNLGRGVSDERAQEIINTIRCVAGISLKNEGE